MGDVPEAPSHQRVAVICVLLLLLLLLQLLLLSRGAIQC
jgi:hypothetical protein